MRLGENYVNGFVIFFYKINNINICNYNKPYYEMNANILVLLVVTDVGMLWTHLVETLETQIRVRPLEILDRHLVGKKAYESVKNEIG